MEKEKNAQFQKALKNAQTLRVTVKQVLRDGVLANIMVQGESVSSGMGSIGGGGGVSSSVYWVNSGKTIFIQDFPEATEDQSFSLKAMPWGRYTYQDITGASRTIERWAFLEITQP